MDVIKEIAAELVELKELPEFNAGDTITVHYKIREGNKERIQQFQVQLFSVADQELLKLSLSVRCLVELV